VRGTAGHARVVAALRAGLPMLVCNRSHAMVLTAASYVADGPVPTILNLDGLGRRAGSKLT
jgi:hypothetical protein